MANTDPPASPIRPEPLLRWFKYEHLPEGKARETSRAFSVLAKAICSEDHEHFYIPPSAERTVALRKLLESKDAAVRASLPPEG